MGSRRNRTRRWAALALVLPPLAASLWAPQEPTAPFPRDGAYYGKLGCRDCHEDQWEAIEAGVHGDCVVVEAAVGCETCHGPGQAHAEDYDNDPTLITHPPTLAAAAQTAVCVQCHRTQIEGHGGDPAGFLEAGKGCTACQSVHVARSDPPYPGLRFEHRAAA